MSRGRSWLLPLLAHGALACEGHVVVQIPDEDDVGETTGAGGDPGTSTSGGSATATDTGSGTAPGTTGPTLGVRFVDVTEEAGVAYTLPALHRAPECLLDAGNPSTGIKPGAMCDPEYMTGGAAAADYDGDGWPDLYVTRTRGADILFRNLGDGTFADVTDAAGLTTVTHGSGAAWADIDNDGDLDLYVTTISEPRYYLFVNQGDGSFVEDAVGRAVALDTGAPHSGFGATFGDYDLDGYVDLHVNEWRPAHESGPPGSHAVLLHNLGADRPGYFEDVTIPAGVRLDLLDPRGIWAFGSAFVDLDDDDLPDLAVTADFGQSRLFWNEGDGIFIDGTDPAMVGTDENGMGSAFGDWDGDGRIDWFVSAIFDPKQTCDIQPCSWGATGNRLFANIGDRKLFDRTDDAGVREGGWGWGAAFLDWDNDGDLDLIMTNGWTYDEVVLTEQFHDDPMRAWENQGDGTMVEVSTALGLTDTGQGRALLTFDYDRDGDLDLFMVNAYEGPHLLRNDGGNMGDHLRVEVRGTISNGAGLGAKITVVVDDDGAGQVRQVGVGSSYLGHDERAAHFGLGEGTDPVRSVTVRWPASGLEQTFEDVPRNTTLTVTEG